MAFLANRSSKNCNQNDSTFFTQTSVQSLLLLAGVVLFLPPQFAGLLVRKGGIRYNIWGGGEVSLPPAVTAAAYPV